MTDLLERYDGNNGRLLLWKRWPELLGASELITAILMAHDAGVYDEANKGQAADIARAFLQGVGYVQDAGRANIGVEEELALLRLKRGIRDSFLILSWPYGLVATTGATGLFLSGTANTALIRLLSYDPLRDYDPVSGTGRYAGNVNNINVVLQDIGSIVGGTRARP